MEYCGGRFMSIEEQMKELQNKRKILLHAKSFEKKKIEEYEIEKHKLFHKSSQQLNRMQDIHSLEEACDDFHYSILSNLAALCGGVLLFGVLGDGSFSEMIVHTAIGVVVCGGCFFLENSSYFALKKRSVTGDSLDFDMEHYDTYERLKGNTQGIDYLQTQIDCVDAMVMDVDQQIKSIGRVKSL